MMAASTMLMMNRKTDIETAFRKQFNCDPVIIASAPGRVNLIGEHTDYNEGFVLPVAIDREVLIAADLNATSNTVELFSAEYKQFDSFSLDDIQFSKERRWSNYLRGVIVCLQKRGITIPSFRAAVSGNVPRGAGLSSSAALEVATTVLLKQICAANIDGKEIAVLAQKAENNFVGVQCGIMDQFVSALAEPDAALLIDCRDLSYESIPLHFSSQSVSIVITHTGVTRGLLDSKFNERRAECHEGCELLKKSSGNSQIRSLRDVDTETLRQFGASLPEVIRRRVKHVVSENDRVQKAAAFLRENNLHRFGELMTESHNSLKNDFEVSCKELDILVELTLKAPGCLGARMTGAGFGGCTVALIENAKVDSYIEQVLSKYEEITRKKPSAYVCRAVEGAAIIT